MKYIKDSYSAWHMVADRPLCTQSYDTMGTAEGLPVGAHACSMCVRALAEKAYPPPPAKRPPRDNHKPGVLLATGNAFECWRLVEHVDGDNWKAVLLDHGKENGVRATIDVSLRPDPINHLCGPCSADGCRGICANCCDIP